MTITIAIGSAILFALAALMGTFAGERLCAGRVPYADGPLPVAYARWPFALAGALVGTAAAFHVRGDASLAVLSVVVIALAAATVSDLRCGMLPDLCTLGPLVLIVSLGAGAHDLAPLLGATLVAFPFALAALVSQGRGMGWGDVKLVALGGALLGARDAALAFACAGVVAYVVARRRGEVLRPIAFGPYLAASILAAITLGGSA